MIMSKKRRTIQNRLRRRFNWSTWQRYPGCPCFELPKERGLSYRTGKYTDGKERFYTDLFCPRIEISQSKRSAGGLTYSIALDRYIEEDDGLVRMCQMTPGYQEHSCYWFEMCFDEVKALYEMGMELLNEREQDE